MHAQVIVLAGPSGSGKSRLSERLGLPVLRLDDFYKDGGDPTLPLITAGSPSRRLVPRLLRTSNAGLVDWDHPDSWLPEDALKALASLCETGVADVPVYDIAGDGRTGWQRLDLDGHRLFVAEGVFAQDIVAGCRKAGQLAAAYCVTQHPLVTFWRRLTRDLRERRKPPLVLLRRGLALMQAQPAVVADAVAKGCTVATPEQAYAGVRRLLAAQSPAALPWGDGLRQPDPMACGPTAAVVARMLRDPEYAAESLPRFAEVVSDVHRRFARPVSRCRLPQRPWPRRLGTAYWSLAGWLRDVEGTRYVLRQAYLDPAAAYDRLHRAASAGRLAAVYVGTRTLPRHIALVVGARGDGLAVFDPADGLVHEVIRADFVGRRLRLGGWPRPWTVVVPSVG
ncbi:hypothetical protein [Nocardioides sp. KR10-350]|uniref:hypothetical protein n=1 Tax=Nocardioides cheoyonin TaxID=3156615 RepID=UPI0032B5F47A